MCDSWLLVLLLDPPLLLKAVHDWYICNSCTELSASTHSYVKFLIWFMASCFSLKHRFLVQFSSKSAVLFSSAPIFMHIYAFYLCAINHSYLKLIPCMLRKCLEVTHDSMILPVWTLLSFFLLFSFAFSFRWLLFDLYQFLILVVLLKLPA